MSAAPTDFLHFEPGPERPFFWIRSVDENGFEVDRRFAEAAYEKTRDLRLYRSRELQDEAVRAGLVERAVYAASRAEKTEPVRDPKSYVFAAFARLVDERIERERSIEHTTSSELDRYDCAVVQPKTNQPSIEDRILRLQILEAMKPDQRWIWERRLIGYGVDEIAAELGVTPACLYTRIKRSIQEVCELLRLGRARE